MKEILQVKNFGPISNIIIEIKDINIFIGMTSSGKSTLAKLIAIFKDGNVFANNGFSTYQKLLANSNIDYKFSIDTLIRYELGNQYLEIRLNDVYSNFSIYGSVNLNNSIYIPAERVFFPVLSQSIYSLLSNDVGLPRWLVQFGSKFEIAKKELVSLPIDFLKVNYTLINGEDLIRLDNGDTIKLSEGSSGLQSAIPLVMVIKYFTENPSDFTTTFVIEEPELNLYPSAQKDLLEYIVSAVKHGKDKLVITTHSPYLLTTLDNLIQAGNVARDKIQLEKTVREIVPEKLWLDFDKISCYYLSNGTAISTLDHELQSIGPSNIDDISVQLSETFEQLLALKYKETNE